MHTWSDNHVEMCTDHTDRTYLIRIQSAFVQTRAHARQQYHTLYITINTTARTCTDRAGPSLVDFSTDNADRRKRSV